MDRRGSHIVNLQKCTHGFVTALGDDFAIAIELSVMKATNECRYNVTVIVIEVVIGSG
ncbi:MAG: hypothetical protein ACJA2G_002929 [Cognaticolwellia sp.]|jgi:hypothetical protein